MSVEQIGGKLRALREEQQLTQTALAERMGITSATVSMIERGRSVPSVRQLLKFADALHAEPGDLLGERQPETTVRRLSYLHTIVADARDEAQRASWALENVPDFAKSGEGIDAREILGQWTQFTAQIASDAQRHGSEWWEVLGRTGGHVLPDEERALLDELRRELRVLEDAAPKLLAVFNEARERYRREAHLEAELSAVAPHGILEEMHA
jgi:transcriptional regulator with XRE-family HTH domain